VVAAFKEYPWPGNVRELENVIERAILISKDEHITMRELPDYIFTSIQGKLQEKNQPKANPMPEPEPELLDLESAEKRQVTKALKESEGNISACAKMLGISRNTLYRKMKQYSL